MGSKKFNKYKLKKTYMKSLLDFVDRLDEDTRKIIKDNGNDTHK